MSLSRSSVVGFAVTLLCTVTLLQCRKADPLATRERRPMTVQDIADGSLPVSTAVGPQVEQTRVTLSVLRAAVGFWRLEHGRTQCPTIRDLASSTSTGFNQQTMALDPWGSAFEIDCLAGTVRLRSLGPDRRAETPDDILSF